jgi:hypothetical protein
MEQPAPRSINWAGGEERLLTAAGLTLELQGSGEQLFSWAPRPKRALDLELRIQPIFGFSVSVPTWRYSYELGHGDGTYHYPGASPGVLDRFIVPHRGLVARLNGKELTVKIAFAGFMDGEPAPAISKVQISVQPAFGSSGRPSIVSQDTYGTALPLLPLRFPAEANEWRLRQLDGQPIPIGTNIVSMLTISGPPVGGGDAALWFDWQPIPALAAFWAATVPCQADYR